MSRLVSVYTERLATMFLYDLLKERLAEPHTNISHRSPPSLTQHQEFVRSRPYRAWFLIVAQVAPELVREVVFGPPTTERTMDDAWVGAIYLTHQREVGIHLMHKHRGRQHGSNALKALRDLYPGPLLANINPLNQPSIDFFARFGARHIQNTYELP